MKIALGGLAAGMVSFEPIEIRADTVAAALNEACNKSPKLREYIFTDQNCLRQHIAVYLDGEPLRDKIALSDACTNVRELYIFQALSGG